MTEKKKERNKKLRSAKRIFRYVLCICPLNQLLLIFTRILSDSTLDYLMIIKKNICMRTKGETF